MKLRYKVLLFCSAVLVYGCKTDSTKKTEETKEVIVKKSDETIKSELDMLTDSTETKWNVMMASDDEKIQDIKRLLDEISKSSVYDKETRQKLLAANERLKKLRYERLTMTDPEITAYDNATDSLVKALYDFTGNTPRATENEEVKNLVTQIQDADGSVGLLRSHYDIQAKRFNDIIRNYQPQLQKMGKPYQNLKPLPLFEVQE
jgi:hypothetical protein